MQRLGTLGTCLIWFAALASSWGQNPSVPAPAAPPKGDTIQLEADYWEMDQKTGDTLLKGNVKVTAGDVRLFSERARANTKTKVAIAEGNVVLRKGYKEWRSDRLEYNFATGGVKADISRAELEDGMFFEAKSLESKDRSRYILKDGYFTTSDYDRPGYHFKAQTIIVYPDDRISLRHIVFYAGDVPIFYFPYMVIPLNEKVYGENIGTQVQVGSKGNWGFFALNSYSTVVADGFRPTFHLDYRTQRGVAGGVDVRYKAGTDPKELKEGEWSPRVSGKVKTYYAHDEKIRDSGPVDVVTSTRNTTERIAPERYQARVTQKAELTRDISSSLKFNKLSDINFQEDFFEREFQRDPQPDSYFEITKWSPNTTLSLLTRPQVNDFFTTTERLPEVRYDLKRQNIFGSPFFYEGGNSAGYLSREFSKFSGDRDYETLRADTFHQVLYPQRYFGWLSFTPKVGARATFYDQSRVNVHEPSVVRGVLNGGFESGFKMSRTWKNVSNKQWEINGLRHLVEPTVDYAFVTRPTKRPQDLYQFDTDRSSFGVERNLVPLHFPQYTGVDSINKRNVFRPLLRQRLQTQRDGGNWDLADLSIYQDILVDKTAGEKTLSDLFGELSLKPVRWLSLDWRGRYDYDGGRIRETTSALSFYKDKKFRMSTSHSYFRGVGEQLGLQTGLSLNEDWAFRTDHRLDPSTGTLLEQSYGVDRDLHSWIMTFSVSELRPQNRDPEMRFWLSFTLKAFPEVSLDSNQFGPSKSE